jgi:hypothetical protein
MTRRLVGHALVAAWSGIVIATARAAAQVPLSIPTPASTPGLTSPDSVARAERDSVRVRSVMAPDLRQTMAGASMGVVGAVVGLSVGMLTGKGYTGGGVGAAIGELTGVTLGVRMSTENSKAPLLLDVLVIGSVGAVGGALVSQVPYGTSAGIVTLGALLAQASAASSLELTRGCCVRGAPSRTAARVRLIPVRGGISLVANISR